MASPGAPQRRHGLRCLLWFTGNPRDQVLRHRTGGEELRAVLMHGGQQLLASGIDEIDVSQIDRQYPVLYGRLRRLPA